MKTLKVTICIGVIALAAWIYKWKFDEQISVLGGFNIPDLQKPETPDQRLERNVREAKIAFSAAITNDVVGYYRTIKQDPLIGFGQAPSNWWATATVEFVNKVGGIERTVLYYRFKPSFGSVELIRMTGDEFIEWAGIKTK